MNDPEEYLLYAIVAMFIVLLGCLTVVVLSCTYRFLFG